MAAAALLESLLNLGGQTEADFLQPGKAKLQKAVQVRRSCLCATARSLLARARHAAARARVQQPTVRA